MNPFRRTPQGSGILLAFLILMLALAGCEKGTLGAKGGSVSGYILDSRTLAGVQGVSVVAATGNGDTKATKYTTSDSKGNFYFGDMRAGEWQFSLDKVGYVPIIENATNTPRIVVVNNEHKQLPEIRFVQSYSNINILVRGSLKDAITGTPITLGTAQFIFGTKVYNNEIPTRFESGFMAPATEGDIQVTIKVTNYDTYTTTLAPGATDRDLGIILLRPVSYKIIGVWKDLPSWVTTATNNSAKVFAYAQNRVIATGTANMAEASFELSGIPMGQSVTIEAEVRGYRMNSPVLVTPNSNFQGTMYQTLSLKNNFTAILRDVRLLVYSTSITSNDRVGGYCNETGTEWPVRNVTRSDEQVVDLGVNQVPTGYALSFSGYNIDDGRIGQSTTIISDDGPQAQVVRIQL
jgi:hypothetical protein